MPSDLPPLALLASALMLGAFALIATVGPMAWIVVARRLFRGEPILDHEPRRTATWGVMDMLIVIVLWVLFTAVFATIARQTFGLSSPSDSEQDAGHQLYYILIESLARMLAAFATGGFILLRTNCSLRDLGFSLADLGRDLRLGGVAFCALAIPTYGIQAVLTQFWKSEHPLIESLKLEREPQFIAIALFAAVISAPLTEEFLFRVLLQGWLEKLFDPAAARKPGFFASLLVGEQVPPEPVVIQAELAQGNEPGVVYIGPETTPSSPNPFASPVVPAESGIPTKPSPPRLATDFLPILASAAIFALLHYSHGPDWIPLLGLAVGLGYLYRRTHRVVPGLVVHFLLNLVSMLALCVSLYAE